MSLFSTPLDHPVKSICLVYAIRTLSLLILAWTATYLFPSFSPLGYDTSSTHITEYGDYIVARGPNSPNVEYKADPVERLVTALTRWDAIYFTSIARYGYRWEQEWAFGTGQRYLLQGYRWLYSHVSSHEMTPSSQILFFSICSCISHLASAIILFYLTALLFETAQPKRAGHGQKGTSKFVAFLAAILHVLSPAGIFLIAPYNEPLFSVLSFLGYWLYVYAIKNVTKDGQYSWKNEVSLLASGLIFGVSSLFRSNGIINGILFAFELSQSLWRLSLGVNPTANFRLLIASGISGILAGLPTLWRQYRGWAEYCTIESETRREWCAKLMPSIYSFVQSHYWGVGLFKYWTPGNIPLFLLASPMLYILIRTSLDIIGILRPQTFNIYSLKIGTANKDLLFRLTIPQLILAILAITNYHVQIITRLSSGLPMWYIVMATALIETSVEAARHELKDLSKSSEGGEHQIKSSDDDTTPSWSRPALRFFLGYQVVQAVLYGGFLPPA